MKSLNIIKLNRWLLCGILFSLPFERIPSLSVGPGGLTIRISQVLGLVLIMINLPLVWSRRKALMAGPWIWLVAFNLLSLISALASQHRGHSLKIAMFVAFVSLLSFVVAHTFQRQDIKQYAIWGGVGLTIACVFGIYQFFGDLAGLPGWATGLREQYMKGGIFPFPRIQSTALEPLFFANYLLVPLSIVLLLQVFIKRTYWVLSLTILSIVSLSLSRGAQLAAACVLLAVIAIATLRRRYTAAGGLALTGICAIAISILLIALGSFLYPQYNGTRNTAKASVNSFAKQSTNIDQGESAKGRSLGRKIALNEARRHPVIGVGPGNYGYYAYANYPTEFGSSATVVNNEPLEIAAEEGFIGLALMIGFAISLFLLSINTIKKTKDPIIKLATTGLLIGLVAITIQYQLFSTLYITYVWVYIGLLAGLVKAKPKTSR